MRRRAVRVGLLAALLMNLKKALLNTLEEKQVRLFETKKRGDRKTDRHYAQIVSTIDELKRTKQHGKKRSKKHD